MADPVVSSKYGKRPLLDIPAFQVESQQRQEITSLQEPVLIYRPGGIQPPVEITPSPVPPPVPPGPVVPYAPMPVMPLSFPPPMRLQPPPHHFLDPSGQMVPAPTFPMHPPAPLQMYPGVHNPYGQGYIYNGAPPMYPQPPLVHYYPQHMAPAPAMPENFRVEGVLEFGVLTTVKMREVSGGFRGLPEFMRRELQKTYGRYPCTDIKIIAQNGEYHIYATPRNEGDNTGDGFESDPGNQRLVQGFNNVR